ncbi:PepSY domain-containing protein [Comamonas sp.]|uniref:PepSY domain-containing protein n=1 Tax=Comamonas sp. TaxID=34028 RepID=UPI00289DBF20|nr:PepSY domain-containing protein [Comamonas sp.]
MAQIPPGFSCIAAWSLAGSLLLGGASQAAEHDAVRAAVATGQYKPLSAILSDIAASQAGRVVDVETKRGPKGELRYEIKLVDHQGLKQELLIDAASGQTVQQVAKDRSQALGMLELAQYLAKLAQQHTSRITDVEFERDSQGRGVYEIKLSADQQGYRKLVMDAATGQVLPSAQAKARNPAPLKRVDEVLHALAPRFSGQVLEVELEHDESQGSYYDIELLQGNGNTLKLKVDARSLQVLKQKIED